MESFKTYLEETKKTGCTCWTGYKRVPGTKPCAPGSCVKEETVVEGAAIVVAQAPIHIRNPKKAPQPFRNQGDIVPPTQPASTEKRGVKGRPGQRPMPTYEELSADEQFDLIEELVMDLAEEHNVDPETIWEKFESIDDDELFEAAVEYKLNEQTADELGDKIDNAKSTEHAKSIISKAATKHLQYLHHWNMGLSGARTHKDMPHIKAELHKRKSMLSDTESAKRFDEEVDLEEAAVDAKGYKSSTGGLTQKGRDYYNRQSGGNLKAPVTTPPSKLKPGSKAANRRKSFCARMSGVDGPMKKPNGEPTRKALALRKWNC